MICPSCTTENQPGAKFCVECGTALSLACPSCGASHAPAQRFCAECGSQLGAAPAAVPPTRDAPAAERRLVSVLFADLVGFTTASEHRDSEETRELLSSYFDLARTLIGRYGGQVEKFIGDAVMAVWGTPAATEDDAERAVRAALELVAAVPELDPALQARAAVLTGEAAVTIGAEGQGMVAGDLVNTASRIQSAAEPGSVLVGETTRRASEQAIVYEPAGAHELKGKAEPVELYEALRVISARRGQLKSTGLEAPFVGRDRELKLMKDLFHASAQDRRAHLTSITGIPGYGKSRLVWEFEKYIDGIVEQIWWHRGRCLAYGEGVAYWALADMVRMRCRIAEDEPAESMREKLKATLEEHCRTPKSELRRAASRQPAGPRRRRTGDRQDLFAAWRLLFERLADTGPTVLAFEDMHWADAGLLDFVEYLLEWSRDYPLYVITLARPELQERRPGWGAAQRNFTSLYLEALPNDVMEELLDGLAPGLPARLRDQILDRAEGVPLYAMETVRMLWTGAPGARRDRLQADGRGRDARSAGDAPRADRRTPRRRVAGRAPRAPGRRRARQDLLEGRAQRPLGALGSRAGAAPARRSPAKRCWACNRTHARPSMASTASSRTSSATSPTRRSPSASGRHGTWRPPPISRASSPTKTSRRGARIALPRRRRCRAGRGRCQRDPRQGTGDARASGRARGIARRDRGRRNATSSRPRDSPTSRSTRRGCSSKRTARTEREPVGRGTGAPRAGGHAVRRGGRHALGRAASVALADVDADEGAGPGGRPPRASHRRARRGEPDAELAGALAQLGRMQRWPGRRARRGAARARAPARRAPAAGRGLRRGPHQQGDRPQLLGAPRRGARAPRGGGRPALMKSAVRRRYGRRTTLASATNLPTGTPTHSS